MLLPVDYEGEGAFPRLSRRLRLGVVGGGRVAGLQAMAARMTDRWELVAGAFSSSPKRAKEVFQEWYVDRERSYLSFEEMAEEESKREDGVDAVMVTTPNHLHYRCVDTFLRKGIHVLCDKPLTHRLEDAERLLGLKGEGVCGVSYVMACFAVVREAREIVREGGLGKINQIHVEFMQDWMVPEEVAGLPHVKWRLDPEKSGKTSCVGDIGTHAAHLAEFVSGLKMTHLRADFHVCGFPKELEDTSFMATRYEGGIPGSLMVTRLATGKRGGLCLRIFGSEGGLEWDLENSERLKYYRYGESDRVISRGHGHGMGKVSERLVRTARGFPEGFIEAWANLYTEFAVAVASHMDGKRCPELGMAGLEEGVRGVRFIEASVKSHEGGGNWVEI